MDEGNRVLALRPPPGAPLQVRSGAATRSGAPTALRASHLERRSDSAPTLGALALRLRSNKKLKLVEQKKKEGFYHMSNGSKLSLSFGALKKLSMSSFSINRNYFAS